jgi:hypothetical protein
MPAVARPRPVTVTVTVIALVGKAGCSKRSFDRAAERNLL